MPTINGHEYVFEALLNVVVFAAIWSASKISARAPMVIAVRGATVIATLRTVGGSVLVCLFGTIEAHALADVHAQRTPAAVDPDVIGLIQKYRLNQWVHRAI
jgi:hypothetical protein